MSTVGRGGPILIHAPARGATLLGHRLGYAGPVSIHAPAWGATPGCGLLHAGGCRFNPRPRMGSDRGTSLARVGRQVSIHAPAWGATKGVLDGSICPIVSIHAPAWGATKSVCIWSKSDGVSIHAPAWGATGQSPGAAVRVDSFNPRPRMGSDRDCASLCRGHGRFQSTPPHGERQASRLVRQYVLTVSIHAPAWGATGTVPVYAEDMAGFNPRPRMGSDVRIEIVEAALLLFQSTPPHGERPSTHGRYGTACKFQSTPPHGERPANCRPSCGDGAFQSTPPHGERPKIVASISRYRSFNPRPRMGSDEPPPPVPPIDIVSIHAPAWGATYRGDASAQDSEVSIHAPAWGAT